MIGREPCSITDDPYNDYSDYVEGEGVYKSNDEDEDRAYEEERQKEIDNKHPLELYATFINSLMERHSAK
jgi:hypothetical protein